MSGFHGTHLRGLAVTAVNDTSAQVANPLQSLSNLEQSVGNFLQDPAGETLGAIPGWVYVAGAVILGLWIYSLIKK